MLTLIYLNSSFLNFYYLKILNFKVLCFMPFIKDCPALIQTFLNCTFLSKMLIIIFQNMLINRNLSLSESMIDGSYKWKLQKLKSVFPEEWIWLITKHSITA